MKRKMLCVLILSVFTVNLVPISSVQAYESRYEVEESYYEKSNKSILDINIISKPAVTVEQAKAWAKSKGATQTFINLADIFWKYAETRGGVNPTIAYVQSAKETGYGKFGGVLDESYFNTCGMKNSSGGGDYDPNAHKRFGSWTHGAIAHIDHLAIYAGATGFPKTIIIQDDKGDKLESDETYDVRHFSYLMGKAPTAVSLGGNWAPSSKYGSEIVRMHNDLLICAGVLSIGWIQEEGKWYYLNKGGDLHKGWLNINGYSYYLNSKGEMLTGWQDIDGKTYYFKPDGSATKGNVVINGIEYFFNSDGSLANGWTKIEDNWYYINSKGNKCYGWLELGGYTFYLGDDGIMRTRWQKIDGYVYYFRPDGSMITGQSIIDDKECEFSKDGKLIKINDKSVGWIKIDDNWYYQNANGEHELGWLELGGYTFYLGEDGIMRTSWNQIEDSIFYFRTDGSMVKDENSILNNTYMFNKKGQLITEGWIKIDNNWFYNNATGLIQKGWLSKGGYKFYLGNDGIMQTGWQDIDKDKYYFRADGSMVTGTCIIDGKEYKFDNDGKFIGENILHGWIKDGVNWYYYNNGNKQTDWIDLGDYRFYLGEDGVMRSLWQLIDDSIYYFRPDGSMVNMTYTISDKTYLFGVDGKLKSEGWIKLDNKWYYNNSKGTIQKGWLIRDGYKFYLGTDGVMQTGWKEIEGNKYYFKPDGSAAKGSIVIEGVKYFFDSECRLVENSSERGWVKKDDKWYYYDEVGIMVKGWLNLDGYSFYLDENGIMQTGWLTIDSSIYYFKQDGSMVKNESYIDGVKYSFNNQGKLLNDGWIKLNNKWYYNKNSGEFHIGWLNKEGYKFYLDLNGVMQIGNQSIDGEMYYFYNDGHMATSEWVDGKYYSPYGNYKSGKDNQKFTIVIDPGHNDGGDQGAFATHNGVKYSETEINMQIAMKLKPMLESKGYNVVLTREPLNPEYVNLSESLKKRIQIAENNKADFFISIHQNSHVTSNANGIEIYYDTYRPNIDNTDIYNDANGNKHDSTPRNVAKVSQNYSKDFIPVAASNMGMYNRGSKVANFYVTRNATMPSVLVECGFISNSSDVSKISNSSYQQKIANTMAEQLNKFFRK